MVPAISSKKFTALAVLLLIAANISLRSRKVAKEEDEAKVQKDYQKEATNAKARAKRVRDREKFYKGILKKIGEGKMQTKDYNEMRKLGLNPDEIRIKLDQIMEWNDKQVVAKEYKMLYNEPMISESLKDRRIKNAEKACRESRTDWAKNFWFNVFSKLCKMYGREAYFNRTVN